MNKLMNEIVALIFNALIWSWSYGPREDGHIMEYQANCLKAGYSTIPSIHRPFFPPTCSLVDLSITLHANNVPLDHSLARLASQVYLRSL